MEEPRPEFVTDEHLHFFDELAYILGKDREQWRRPKKR